MAVTAYLYGGHGLLRLGSTHGKVPEVTIEGVVRINRGEHGLRSILLEGLLWRGVGAK